MNYQLTIIIVALCQQHRFHASLLDNAELEKPFAELLGQNLVEIGTDDYYQPSPKGKEAYERLLSMQTSYLRHFDVYGHVDLVKGCFANLDRDNLDDPRWNDLRIAVATYKGIAAQRMVFLALLADNYFFEQSDWTFDLALGEPVEQLIDDIVANQIKPEDLAYTTEDGQLITADEVIEDIISAGAKVNQSHYEAQTDQQNPQLLATINSYINNPRYAESIWYEPLWE